MPRVQISVPDRQTQPYRFPIDREKVTLGRGSDNDISLKSGSVSVHHAEMIRVPGGFELRDLDSTNGITYNGERKIFLPLKSGMEVKMGAVIFQFELTEEEEEILAKESPHTKTQPKSHDPDKHVPEEEESEGFAEQDEEKPKRQPKRNASSEMPSSRPPAPASQSSGTGVALIFLIFAAIAFFVGMALRHEKDTGKPLLDAIMGK